MLFIQIFIVLLLTNGFSAETCNFDVELHHELHDQGFHRNLSFYIKFGNKFGDRDKYEKCSICVEQKLPAGLYAKPEDLVDMTIIHRLPGKLKDRLNVELLAEDAKPRNVYMRDTVVNGEASVWWPVHARYHRAAKGGGFATNVIGLPRIFMYCPHISLESCEPLGPLVQIPCPDRPKGTYAFCTWMTIPFTSRTTSLSFSVPIGNMSHYYIVAPVTLFVVICSTLCLLKTLHDYKLTQDKKRS